MISLEGDLKGLRFQSYQGMGHDVFETELEDLRLWIAAVLSKPVLDLAGTVH